MCKFEIQSLQVCFTDKTRPFNSEALSHSTGTAASSPFVIAFKAAGINVLPSIINAVVCTSAISSGSACIFLASRTLYGLSADGHAPKLFMKCNRFGTPWYAVALSVMPSPLVYMVVSTESSIVFGWFVNITTIAGLIGWVVIGVTYLRFYYAMKVQSISRDCKLHFLLDVNLTNIKLVLPYKSPLQPYVAYMTTLIVFLIIFFSGYAVFFPGNFTASGFLTYYINIAIFAVLYIFFKFFLKSKIIPLRDIDFSAELESISCWKESEENPENVHKKFVKRTWNKIF